MKKKTGKPEIIKLLFLLIFSVSFLSFIYNKDVINIGNNRELFVDYYLIEKLNNVSLRLNTPVEREIVLKYDKPWEGMFSAYPTILKDKNIYRLYYRGILQDTKTGKKEPVTCYAESFDGLKWNKPALKIYESVNFPENNIVLMGDTLVNHNFCPFIDTKPGVNPKEKYKAVGGDAKCGLNAYVSADGIHWERYKHNPLTTEGQFDSQNVVFWSETEKCYVCYLRTWTGGGFEGFRSVSRIISTDFINWSKPVQMDFGNRVMEHIYVNQTQPYYRAPQIYISLAVRFVPDRKKITALQAEEIKVNPNYFNDLSDVVLLTSRGGNRYDRTFLISFITPGYGDNNWVSRTNYPALNSIQTSQSEISLYVNKNYAQPTSHLKRYTIRIDGFTSINAPYEGGDFITKPFKFSGDKLLINYSTSSIWYVLVEIQDENYNPVENFTFSDSDEIFGDEIDKIVTWKGKYSVSNLKDKTIRLKFKMKDANLYSLKFD
jgi:hypothetical protein